MKQTKIYKWLEKTQIKHSIYNGDFKGGFLENIANIITVPALSNLTGLVGTPEYSFNSNVLAGEKE